MGRLVVGRRHSCRLYISGYKFYCQLNGGRNAAAPHSPYTFVQAWGEAYGAAVFRTAVFLFAFFNCETLCYMQCFNKF